MGKKLLFIIVSVLLMIGITVYMAINLQKESAKEFKRAGYILNTEIESGNKDNTDNTTVKYYFDANTSYRNSYNDNVEFKDTNGNKVKVSDASFIHYDDDSISILKKGVILNLEDITKEVPIYYNLFESTLLKYNNGVYSVDNLGKELKFKRFICRVSENKYLIVSDDIKLNLDENTSTTIKTNYVEVSIVEEGIIKIENSDSSYQTVATNASVVMGDITLNLDNGYFFYKGEAKINLNSMIIDSNDNIDITPLEEINDLNGEENDLENNEDGNGNVNGSNSGENEYGGSVGNADDGNTGNTGISENDFTPTETEVEENELTLPTATVSDVAISANTFSGSITINDPNSIIVGTSLTTIMENSTGRLIFERVSEAGIYNIDVFAEGLTPETSYSLTTTVTYLKNDIEYTMDVVQQLFVTSSIGISIEKDYYTPNELGFIVKIDNYSKVKSANVSLLNSSGEVLEVQNVDDEIAKDDAGLGISFVGLEANTKYTVLVDNILYEDDVISNDYAIEKSAKTLKYRPTMGTLTYTIDKKNSLFTLKMNNMVDSSNGVENYRYEIYDARTVGDGASPIMTLEKATLGSIDLPVDDVTIKRGIPYCYKVIALFYDNEKYIEYTTGFSSNMQMDGVQSPTISWTTDDESGGITFESINGYITVLDPAGTIDYDKPMTVVYTNSIGTTKSFVATSGNTIIPFNENNLRANETYTISLFASVNLMDENDEIDAYHVGSIIVKTNPTKSIDVTYQVDSQAVSEAFKVYCKLLNVTGADNTLEANTLSQLTFVLYEGSTTTGTVVKTVKKVDRDRREYVSTLKEDYYDNGFYLTADFFGMRNTDFDSEYYTIAITDAKDYTDFQNSIPLINSTVTVQVHGFIEDPDENRNWFSTELIRNKDAGDYNKYDSNLDAETIVGIKVKSNFDNSRKYGVNLTYYVFDITNGLSNMYEVESARKTINFASDGSFDYTYYWFDYGTDSAVDDSQNAKLRRGHIYQFSFVGGLDLNNDGVVETRYPANESKRLKSNDIEVPKQAPTIAMYPSLSTNDSLTIKYKLTDKDHSLTNNQFNATITNSAGNILLTKTKEVTPTNTYNAITFDGLNNEGFLKVTADISSYKNNNYTKKTYIDQYFEKTYTLPNISYSLMVDVNRILISINNYESLATAISHIAGLKLTFNCDGRTVVKDFVRLNGDNAVVDMYDLSDFLGKTINLTVQAYYDNNLIGWDMNSNYVALQSIKDVYGGGEYFTINSSNNLVESNIANGSIHTLSKETNNYLITQAGNLYKYRISSEPVQGGIRANGTILNIKKLVLSTLTSTNSTFTFNQIIPGISLENDSGILQIAPAIQTVSFNANIYGVASSYIKDSKVYVQVSKTDAEGSYLENFGDPHIFTVDKINEGVCQISDLSPGTDYALEFFAYIDNGQGGYDYKKLYDLDDNSDRRIYYFKTLSGVGINKIKFAYKAISYEEKFLQFTYNLDRIMGYDKIRYEIFKEVKNPTTGLAEYEKVDIDIPDDIGFKSSMTKTVPCPPDSLFDFGSVYYITITPYVDINVGGTVEEVALNSTIGKLRFNLRSLHTPYVGVSSNISSNENSDSQALDFRVNLYDTDKVVVNGKYTIYVEDQYGNDVTPVEYASEQYDILNYNKLFTVGNLQDGVTYYFHVVYQTNMTNKSDGIGIKNYVYTANSLNPNGISIGSVLATPNARANNQIDLNFTNSYRIASINNLRYSIYNSLDGSSFDNEIDFQLTSKTIGDTVVYSITLPENLETEGIYYIQLQFISEDNVIEESTIQYNYFY